MVPPRRPSMGRQKIEIRRIESEEARQVCFSKRRAGLFKKASELSTLCGAQVAAVVFSPAGKAFSFGHPSVEDIVDRFVGPSPPEAAGGIGLVGGAAGGDQRPTLAELNQHYGELRAQLDVQKARRERLEERIAAGRAENGRVSGWVDADVRQMVEDDLVAYGAALMDVYEAVKARADQVLRDALAAGGCRTRVPPPVPFGAGGGGFVDIGQFGGGGFEVGQSSGTANGGGMQQGFGVPPGFFGPPHY